MAFSKARRLSDSISATGEVSAFVDGAIVAADLNSTLDLTGKTITVANASTGDSDTTVANTAFVQQEIAALVASAPGTLNTLNELAAALGDDASFSTTITNSIATKLPLSGGAMTGPITTNSTFDGVDIATRDAVLTSTTTTANAALPLAGGTMTGALAMNTNAITSTGDLTLDVAGVINLDADGAEVAFKDGGTHIGSIINNNSDFVFRSIVQDKDVLIRGNDGGSAITALTLDMSNNGAAVFNSSVSAPGGFINGSNGGIRVHTGGTKFFNVTAANAARDNIMDVGASDARFKDGWFGGTVSAVNFKINNSQGSDGQVLTSTGSGVAWEAAVSSFATLSDTVVSTSAPAVNTNPSSGVGTLWLNRSAGEIYVLSDATTNSNIWLNLGDAAQVGGAPTGGTESTAGGYTYHAFTSSGTLIVPAAKTGVDVLIVAGGGGGGGRYNSGGGGAGGMLEYTNQTFNGNHTVTVGSGGAGGAHDNRGTQGGSSSISGPSGSWTTAVGGGGGGGWNTNGEGGDGGSGGGASGYQTGNTSQGSGTSGQGTDGGRGASYGAGGGGGKTATSHPTGGGQNGTNTQGGDGGPGKQWLNGTTYAGGGGGSDYGTSGGQGVGGAGGGGTGGSHGNGNINGAGTLEGTDGTANTGGGGGGASGYGAANDTSPMAIGGNGGSGIVIFRYAT